MKRMAAVLLVSLIAITSFACWHHGKASVLRIATQPSPTSSPLFVAKQQHWIEDELKKEGVSVVWTSFMAGPPENESFFAGQQDIGIIGDTPVIVARSAGLDSRVVGIASTGPKALALIARQKSKIRTVADLKGRKVAVTKGSYAHHLLFLLLKNAGLTPDDIKLVHLAPADLITAFNAGDVEAAVTWEPYLSRIEKGNRRIADGTGIKQGAVVFFTLDKFAKANPNLVVAVLKSYQRGYEYIQAHPKEAAVLISPEVRLDPAEVEAIFPKYDYNPVITPAAITELKATEVFLRESGLSKGPVDIDKLFDTSYLGLAGLH
jgi:sulfonate transport system substrate-binding protein